MQEYVVLYFQQREPYFSKRTTNCGKVSMMNLRKLTIISFLIGVFFLIPLYLGAADRAAEENVSPKNTSNPIPMSQPDTALSKSSETLRLDKHARKGVKCIVCHESAQPSTPPNSEKCSSCHGDMGKKATAAEAAPNPHKSHVGELLCGKCHKEHKESVLFCNKCHVLEMKVP